MINDEEFKKKLREVHPGTYDMTSRKCGRYIAFPTMTIFLQFAMLSNSDSLKGSEQQRQKKKREEPQERQ